MDRLMARGHGPAVYGYGWGWFRRCLRAADTADKTEARARRCDQASLAVLIRLAVHDEKGETLRDRIREMTRE